MKHLTSLLRQHIPPRSESGRVMIHVFWMVSLLLSLLLTLALNALVFLFHR